MYYYLRLLSTIKSALGYLTTRIAFLYTKLGAYIASCVDAQITKIEEVKDRNINKAKEDVIIAAQRVVELEQAVGEVAQKERDNADNKIFKLKTKVQ